MPGLNKRQREFRKQMQELESNKYYKEIIDDHNSFYHNKAYELEKIEIQEKNKRIRKKIWLIVIIGFIGIGIHKNFEIIKGKLLPVLIANVPKQSINNYNKITHSTNEIEQNQVAGYQENYKKHLNILNENIIELANNFNIDKANERMKIIDDLIIMFNNYEPEKVITNLHNINKTLLENYKGILYNLILIKTNQSSTNIISNFNYYNDNLKSYNILYRTEFLNILTKLDMPYTIDESGVITFTYIKTN